VLAATLTSDRDLPPFNRAQMDGYALRAQDFGRVEAWPVVASIAAGQPADVAVPSGQCVAIATGAPLPADVDTVIQHELSDRADPVRFTVDSVETGHAVHPRGADAQTGDVLIAAGTVLGPHHLGIAATAGAQKLKVHARPRVVVLTSGDEVVPINADLAPHQIRNSNGPMSQHLLTRMGAQVIDRHHLADDRDATIAALAQALEQADLVATIGGISAGTRDFFTDAFEQVGVVTAFHGAAIQPGGPMFVGRVPEGPIVLGLPGNPVSVLACACLFGWPLLRTLGGADPTLRWQPAALAHDVHPNPRRRAYRPCTFDPQGTLVVPPWGGSGDLAHTAITDGLAELPVQEMVVPAGAKVRFLPWP
jgi:molybdopterin molybdotransferase